MENALSIKEWLQIPCLEEDILGDPQTGYYLGILKIREKIKYMEETFNVRVNYSNFHHFMFNRMDKEVFSSGSIEIEISEQAFGFIVPIFNKKLIGAYTFNITDYDNPQDKNEQYAGTTKSLCIGNALSNEYPAFGSLLNRKELIRTIQGRRPGKTSDAIKNALKGLS